jgi:hypothetical protein
MPDRTTATDAVAMRTRTLVIPLTGFILAGCSAAGPATSPAWSFAPETPRPSTVAASNVVEVYKSPACDCCHEWEAYMRSHGYTVRSIPTDDMSRIKADHGLPRESWSCHTAVIAGYAVEGHVPVEAIEDLLTSRPAIDGIALPAMPSGSPGMPGDKVGRFEILAVDDGATRSFGSY